MKEREMGRERERERERGRERFILYPVTLKEQASDMP
jgi:hypothetical protein